MTGDKKFNVRVYGLLVWEKQVLVVDEWLMGDRKVTKFPGGGLEWGEGIADCLHREFAEELGLDITIKALFYINEFFQPSAYNSQHQVISIYYMVNTASPQKIAVKSQAMDFTGQGPGEMAARWIPTDQLDAADFYFPIDKKAVAKLIDQRA